MYYPYDTTTGLFTGASFDVRPPTPEALAANTPEGCALYEGQIDPLCHCIDLQTGEPIPYQTPAPAETDEYSHEWDGRRWRPVPKAPVIGRRVRAERARLLAETDWLVTRAIERSEPIPAAWQEYRQALRDIPQQPGFPLAGSVPFSDAAPAGTT